MKQTSQIPTGRQLTKRALLLIAAFAAGTSNAAQLSGTVTDAQGKSLEGVLVRATNSSNVSEAVYSHADGSYILDTELSGKLNIRLRTPYYSDATASVELGKDSSVQQDMVMSPMTDAVEISDSLPAAYHFGNLPFETGDDADFSRYQFQRDCLSCHQLGNDFTRVPRTAKSWSGTIARMHYYLGNFDMKLRDKRAEIFEAGFDGKPLTVRPQFPLDASLANTKIYQYPLLNRGVPHDAIVHPVTGLIYTVDQSLDHMSITDPVTGLTQYVAQAGSTADNYYVGALKDGDTAAYDAKLRHGPHSLALGKDGKYYITLTGNTSIGVFNPSTNLWEASHKIPAETKAVYPHTIKVDAKGMVWFTLAGSEKVGRLDPTDGQFTIIDLPQVTPGGISGGTQPYGIDINPIDDAMWYGRLFGDKIGRIDPVTLAVTEYDSPVRGPRRMQFDKEGTLWVTGYSEGTLARIDTAGFKSKVYTLPEFAEGYRPAPYALGVHPDSQEIWINENMTDRLYKFIPAEERFVVYPVPMRGTYTRDVSFSRDGKICLSNNPIPAPALEGGVLEILCIDNDYKAATKQKVAVN